MNAIALRVVRHIRNFDQMLGFYQDRLGMKYVEGWDHPNDQCALLSPGKRVGNTLIEVLDLDNLIEYDSESGTHG